jgi:predicted O-methyltransferase YrrM
MFQLIEYIKYLFHSQTKHAIHSPYVFSIVNNALTKKQNENTKNKINHLIKSLKKSNKTIQITDFGAGSRSLKNNFRTVKSIVKTSASKKRYAKLLFQMSDHFKPTHILELGTNLGIGSIHLSLGNPDAKIISVDADKNLLALAQENLNTIPCKNVHLIHSTFNDFLETNKHVFDLIFIDGHHDGKALLEYMKILKKFSHNDTVFILDDIRWSKGMLQAWETICKSEDFHVTLDFFKMGIVIPRKQQAKEHFIIHLKHVLISM